MTTGPAFTAVLLAHCAVGGLFGLFDCGKSRHEYRGPDCCRDCASERQDVLRTIAEMQRSPSWRKRDNAAHALRRYDWECHPEIGPALAYTMLTDCDKHVRAEAAETLARLAPCQPEVHVALEQAAAGDPAIGARKWAKKALARLDRRCLGDCTICGPVLGEVVDSGPVPILDVAPSPIRPGVDPRFVPPFGTPTGPYPADPRGLLAPGLDPYPDEAPGDGAPIPFPDLPDPAARPGLMPPTAPWHGESPELGPLEVHPPELPPAIPPTASPFGDASGVPSRGVHPPPTRAARPGAVPMFTSARRR